MYYYHYPLRFHVSSPLQKSEHNILNSQQKLIVSFGRSYGRKRYNPSVPGSTKARQLELSSWF